jgi:hypothetical protein
MSKRPARPHRDPRFTLHRRQPRADKLDAEQRRLCLADPAFKEALRARVSSAARFSAFLAGSAYYFDLERPCAECGSGKRRARDRSCYTCHLRRGGENFERMKAGIAPNVTRSRDGHLDLLERKRAERDCEYLERSFDGLIARRWPRGRLEIVFPDGYREPDMSALNYRGMVQAITEFPQLVQALEWAGWTVPITART